ASQFRDDAPDLAIDPSDEPIVVAHGALKHFRCRETFRPATPPFGFLDELWQKPEVLVGRRPRNRNWIAGKEVFVAKVGLKFARFAIAGVRGIETDREAEGPGVGVVI